MQTQTLTSDYTTLFVNMAVTAWQTQNTRVDKFLNTLTDEQIAGEIAPGRNSGTYLLGHLTAVNDNLFVLFGLGERMYPDMDVPFLKDADKAGHVFPSLQELKNRWHAVNEKLAAHFATMTAAQWFERHTAVSEADFAKEPHRNKLNVLLNRTTHQAYHIGQLILLGKPTRD